MARYTNTLRDQNLKPIVGALVSVVTQQGVTATLTDNAGLPLANPVKSDLYGGYSFNTADGIYDLAVTFGGRLVTTLKNVYIGTDPQEFFQGAKGDPGGNVLSVGPFSAISGILVPVGTDLIQTSGATRGILIADPSLSDADVAAHPLAITKTLNGRFFRRDPSSLTTAQFGSVRGADLRAPMIAALAYAFKCGGAGVNYASEWATPAVKIPLGTYTLSSGISIKQSVEIYGEGPSGQTGGTGVNILCSGNGFTFERFNTLGGSTVAGTFGSDCSSLSNVLLKYVGSEPYAIGASFGVKIRARVYIDRVSLQYFPGPGFYVQATAGAGGSAEGNANLFRITQSQAQSCFHNFYAVGGDANAGSVKECDFDYAVQFGVLDESFLGNNYRDIHFADNGVGRPDRPSSSIVHYAGRRYNAVIGQDAAWATTTPGTDASVWSYVEDGADFTPTIPTWEVGGTYHPGGPIAITNRNARAIVDGCYREGSQPRAQILFPSMMFGGIMLQSAACDGVHITGEQGVFNSNRGFAAGGFYTTETGASWSASYSYVTNAGGFHRPLVSTGSRSGEYHLEHNDALGLGIWRAGALVPFITTLGSATLTYGRTAPIVAATEFASFVLGDGNSNGGGRVWRASSGAPGADALAADGERRFPFAPGVGSPTQYIKIGGSFVGTGIAGGVQAAAVALAAGANPTKAEFDALVTALKNAKLMA